MRGLKLLRGRVLIRPTSDSDGVQERLRKAGLSIPDTLVDDPRHDDGRRKNTLGRGVVVDMGPPAFTSRMCPICIGHKAQPGELKCWRCKGTGRIETNVESIPAFRIGDEVMHVGQHKSRDIEWNGETLRVCGQEEVQAVVKL
jgi:hypothetical protein